MVKQWPALYILHFVTFFKILGAAFFTASPAVHSSELNLPGQTEAQQFLIPKFISALWFFFWINLYEVAVSLIKQFVKPNEDGSSEAEHNDLKSNSIEMVMKLHVFLFHVFVCIFGSDGAQYSFFGEDNQSNLSINDA